MRTQILEGTKQQIAQQVTRVEGKIVGGVIFVEELADSADSRVADLPGCEEELDALMALGSANTSPADVSREAIYSPEHT